MKYQGDSLTFPIGLDGRYRLAPCGPFHLLGGAMGRWTSANEFLLDLNFVANINHYTLRLRFEGDRLEMTADETSGLVRDGHITGTRRAASNPSAASRAGDVAVADQPGGFVGGHLKAVAFEAQAQGVVVDVGNKVQIEQELVEARPWRRPAGTGRGSQASGRPGRSGRSDYRPGISQWHERRPGRETPAQG